MSAWTWSRSTAWDSSAMLSPPPSSTTCLSAYWGPMEALCQDYRQKSPSFETLAQSIFSDLVRYANAKKVLRCNSKKLLDDGVKFSEVKTSLQDILPSAAPANSVTSMKNFIPHFQMITLATCSSSAGIPGSIVISMQHLKTTHLSTLPSAFPLSKTRNKKFRIGQTMSVSTCPPVISSHLEGRLELILANTRPRVNHTSFITLRYRGILVDVKLLSISLSPSMCQVIHHVIVSRAGDHCDLYLTHDFAPARIWHICG